MGQITLCNEKEVAPGEATENYQQLCSFPELYEAFYSLLARCFGFTAHNFTILVKGVVCSSNQIQRISPHGPPAVRSVRVLKKKSADHSQPWKQICFLCSSTGKH